ncbi:MAG: hypothetical protein ACXAC5_04940 [Promethearchaeota archaeon]|jgi:hypothetical protein
MKIRTGFVSNSSSSSFILAIRQDAFDEWRTQADPIDQAMAEATMIKDKIFDHECRIYEYASSDYWFDNINVGEIIDRAKEIAKEQGRGIATEAAKVNNIKEEDIDDDWLHDHVGECLYEVRYYFKDYADRTWSHSMDW